jgi:hypothetical protein
MKTAFLAFVLVAGSVAQTLPTIHVNYDSGNGVKLGKATTTIADLDGDGVRDIVATRQDDAWVGTPMFGCPSCGHYVETRGIRVFSGRTGALLMSFDDAPIDVGTQTECFSAVAECADLDADGKNDVVWAVKLGVRVISSQTGATLRSHDFAPGIGQSLPLALASVADADGDGIRDYVIGRAEVGINSLGLVFGLVTLYSGATGAVVWTASEPAPPTSVSSQFGSIVAGLGDVNGDGRSDVAVGGPYYFDPVTYDAGKTVVLSGATGGVVWFATGFFDWEPGLANAGDVNGDGIEDVVSEVYYPNFGGLRWRSGATGAVLGSFTGLDVVPGPIAGGFDVDGDGIPDAALAVHAYPPGNMVTYGLVYSVTGVLLATAPTNDPSAYKTLMMTPDLNGDGYGDLVTAETVGNAPTGAELRARAILGAQPYGTSSPSGASLSWLPLGPQPSYGVVAVTGATPLGPGLLGASAAPFSSGGNPPLWIDPAQLILLQPIQFTQAGTFVIPLDLRQPSIAGVSAFVQAADGALPAVTTTNGLQLLFGN